MRFEKFGAAFEADKGALGPCPKWSAKDTRKLCGRDDPSYTEFMRTTVRSSYDHGLLKFLLPDTSPSIWEWNSKKGWHEDWPQWARSFVVVAYDWLGRQIGFDKERACKSGGYEMALLEPGSGHMLEIPGGFAEFVEDTLIGSRDAVLDRACRRSGGKRIRGRRSVSMSAWGTRYRCF